VIIDYKQITNEIKELLKENPKLPFLLGVSVSLTVVVGTILYIRKKKSLKKKQNGKIKE
jgi:hypothetical protein